MNETSMHLGYLLRLALRNRENFTVGYIQTWIRYLARSKELNVAEYVEAWKHAGFYVKGRP